MHLTRLQVVECENTGYDKDANKFNWRCHAEIEERVRFNHQEVTCEGYDYPEDDYILLGSCGLEFSLDYTNPHDHHENSYFKHMDDHEKEMHRAKTDKSFPRDSQDRFTRIYKDVIVNAHDNALLWGSLVLLALCLFALTRLWSSSDKKARGKKTTSRGSPGYGPLTSAVLTTKKLT